jgi:Ser/Thr protein kinase RdoA (MazF antagonist)
MPDIGPLIGSGRVAEVFEYGDRVAKLYRDPAARTPAFIEGALVAIVGDHGLPTPAVYAVGQYAGRWGLVMDRAPGEPLARFAQGQPELVPDAIVDMVSLHLRMHERPEPRLPSLKARLADRIGRATQLTAEHQQKLLAGLAAMPAGDRLCHGDFHPFNIIGMPGQTMIIDWLDASTGHPAADVCRSFVIMLRAVPELAENYVERYAALSGISREEIFAWLPFVAAARLAEGIAEDEEMLIRLATGGP